MKKILKFIGKLLLVAVIVLIVSIYSNLKDRHRGYSADLKIVAAGEMPLMAGFSAVTITPDVPDLWNDTDGDAAYRPRKGDTFTDGNGNGRFDPVWIAGFGQARAANGIHDDLWARTMVISNGKTNLAIVALDAIGFMNNHVIEIRKKLQKDLKLDYIVVTSTHTHEGPDLLGLWGKSPLHSGVNKKYLEYVNERIIKSVVIALQNMKPARLEVSEDPEGAAHLVKDTREPQVFDFGLRIIRAVDTETGLTLGTLVAWGDHPETLWGKNLLITSDFPHYLREYVEKGIYRGDSLIIKGTGGICLYVNGAVGGLMTTHPDLAVKDPLTGEEFKTPSFEKADAQGKQLAILALRAMENPDTRIEKAGISIIAKTVYLPVDNKLFRLGAAIGILNREFAGWMKMRSEVSAFKIGPIQFATLPGEVYPEIINGGVEAPPERDFLVDPVEVPPVRDMMKEKHKFILGLANDEVGYIIPRSQWDTRKPFAYGKEKAQYGEINSLGPETAPLLHSALKNILEEIQ